MVHTNGQPVLTIVFDKRSEVRLELLTDIEGVANLIPAHNSPLYSLNQNDGRNERIESFVGQDHCTGTALASHTM